ncbi:hypothetical protein A2397_05060 [Candidatus Amesbacteria bacterium RIFOXYB1_FULL_44_23]|uniref:Orn/DAP/Arg decarboxylase 2 N-terminal domain-containing protein n=1 Tax=Candidatus Amesbacteria bacterium RIFOXYB1_FULL_44_23 TaxID=1797263 RepID=A0A1F4ZSZ5_9BACT|nr:MAG: hypothetical protein A2397_05060 [Candidatus Amesbacteria bacterium RIFOXYB1_FULL_44_23]
MSIRPNLSQSKVWLAKYGSPLFVTYEKTVLENIKKYRSGFKNYSGGFTLAYSVKTNNNIPLLKIFKREGVWAEVCSATDIYACSKAGYTGSEILFDGLVKPDSELLKALKQNFSIINLESMGEAIRLSKLATRLQKKINVGIRLSFPSTRVGLKALLGISYDRFGVSLESGDAFALAKYVASQKYLHLTGVHCHTGSNQKSAAHYLIGIDELVTFMAMLKSKLDINIKTLNLGGGFGVSEITAYKVTDLGMQFAKRLLGQPQTFEHKKFDFERVSNEICTYLEKKLAENDLAAPHLFLEPGRSLVGNTTHLICSVVETKSSPINDWTIIDAGTNLMPILTFYSEYRDIQIFSKEHEIKTSMAGPLLYSSDSIVSGRMLPRAKVGDVVLICDTGAYFNCQSNQFLYSRPASILVDKANHVRLIQRAETVKDVFVRDESE